MKWRVRVLFHVPGPVTMTKVMLGEGMVQVQVDLPSVLFDELLLHKLDGVEFNLSPMVAR